MEPVEAQGAPAMEDEPTKSAGEGMRVTPRQAQILRLVASGLSDKEIGSRLGLSPRTIQSHLDRFFLEHGIHKRAAAVAAWLRENQPG
jgi:DNA-binding NarL/FixJ family response regulator